MITMKQARKEFAGRSHAIRKRPTTVPAHLDGNGDRVPAATIMIDVKVRSRSPLGPSFRAWVRQQFMNRAAAGREIALREMCPKLRRIVERKDA